jgi:hypothetical protein
MAKGKEVKQTNLNESIRQVQAIAKEWYIKEEYDPMYIKLISKKSRFDNV